MTKRQGEPLFGVQYCGNTNTMEVHDLDNEKIMCQIDEIILDGHVRPFNTLEDAHDANCDNCYYCMGGSTR